jgi:hypothetical protein
MFVRFRQGEHRLQLSLVETHRDGDTVRHAHVESLGAIATPPTVADRAAFWEQLIKRLAALGERVDYAAIIAAIATRVPPVTDAERHAIPPPNVKPDATAPAECAGVLGIDPGFGGALALYRGPGDWVVIDVPTMGTGKQRDAARYSINPKTVAKWRRRGSVCDARMGPKEPRSTVLRKEEEALIVTFRRHTLLLLNDCLYALQSTIPHLTRSSLHRCLQSRILRLQVGEAVMPRPEVLP